MSSEDIKNRKWTDNERRALRRAGRRQAAGDDSDINFEDVPRLNAEQLANLVRLRDTRPSPGERRGGRKSEARR